MGYLSNDGTLDVIPSQNIDTDEPSDTVNTALKMVYGFFQYKNAKEITVKKVKDYYQEIYQGGDPTDDEQMMSYLPVILVNLFTTLARVPDSRVVNTGYIPEFEMLMSKYLDKKLLEAGYVDMMTTKWSGYHQAAAYGDFFILGMTDVLMEGKRKKLKKGDPLFKLQGLSVGNAWFDRQATSIRSRFVTQDASKMMITTMMSIFEAEEMFPGIGEKAIIGSLPGTDGDFNNPTNKKEPGVSSEDGNTQIEIGFFFDKINRVFSVIAGVNAYEYNTIKDKEFDDAFKMLFRGTEQIVFPVGHYQFEPLPDGIYGSGVLEMFWRIISADGKLNNSLINNVLESNFAPLLLNIENADAGRLMEQLKRGKSAMQNGQRPIIIPEGAADDNGNVLNPVGQGNVGYVKPNELTGENEKARFLMENIMRRLGFNVDFNFSDPNKTLGQTELDVANTNQRISKIQSNNKDFYDFIVWFAVDRIIKYGDVNDDTPFGRDIKIEADGDTVSANELLGQEITEGLIVSLFKNAKKTLDIEIDVNNGFVFNDALERRNLERRLARATPGSQEYVRVMSALSIADGGAALKLQDLTGQDGGGVEMPRQGIGAEGMESVQSTNQ